MSDKEEFELMIKLTKHAESLGFEIKDKLYFGDGSYYGKMFGEGSYYGKIFRYFSLAQTDKFLKSGKYGCSDILISAYENIDNGVCKGQIVDGKIQWEYD